MSHIWKDRWRQSHRRWRGRGRHEATQWCPVQGKIWHRSMRRTVPVCGWIMGRGCRLGPSLFREMSERTAMQILVLLAGTGPAAGRGSTRSAASAPHATRAPENPPIPRTARERSMLACTAESSWNGKAVRRMRCHAPLYRPDTCGPIGVL